MFPVNTFYKGFLRLHYHNKSLAYGYSVLESRELEDIAKELLATNGAILWIDELDSSLEKVASWNRFPAIVG